MKKREELTLQNSRVVAIFTSTEGLISTEYDEEIINEVEDNEFIVKIIPYKEMDGSLYYRILYRNSDEIVIVNSELVEYTVLAKIN